MKLEILVDVHVKLMLFCRYISDVPVEMEEVFPYISILSKTNDPVPLKEKRTS